MVEDPGSVDALGVTEGEMLLLSTPVYIAEKVEENQLMRMKFGWRDLLDGRAPTVETRAVFPGFFHVL